MTTEVQKNKQENAIKAYGILQDLYQNIDDTFISYFISLTAPGTWRPHLEKYESDYRKTLQEEGYSASEIEQRIAVQDHIFREGTFSVQTQTARLRKILILGSFENHQAKKAIQTIYDDWDSFYRKELEDLLDVSVVGDIWGDIRHIRRSITHRRSVGVAELKNTKLIKDFLPEQEIIFTSIIMEKIKQELDNWYTQCLMKYFPRNSE